MAARQKGRPRSEQAKQAILNSAYQLLTSNGLSGVTIEAVASQAGVGKPTIYRYWKNANELAMAAIMAKSKPAGGQATDADPIAALTHQLRSVIDLLARPPGRQIAILMAAADTETELSKAFRNQIILRSRRLAGELLSQAIERNIINVRIPAAQRSERIETMLDMIYGPVFFRLLSGHAPLKPGLADDIVETLLAGISA